MNSGLAGKHVVVINGRDNVGVAMDKLCNKDVLDIVVGDSKYSIVAKGPTPRFHKVAVTNIAKGEKVLKYGETIGIALRDILSGEHVHTHNIRGLRG